MLAELFCGFWIYSAGFISGLLCFPLLARVLLSMIKRKVKR